MKDDLLEAINTYYHEKGEYPKVLISRQFWEDHSDIIAKLHGDGIQIEVSDNMFFQSFKLSGLNEGKQSIDTLNDLKELVDKLVREGKGSWKVRTIPPDANVHLPISLQPIIPNDERFSLAGNPNQEFILIEIGD